MDLYDYLNFLVKRSQVVSLSIDVETTLMTSDSRRH